MGPYLIGLLERGYKYLGIGVDVDMHIDSDMAASMNWGSFKRELWGSFKGRTILLVGVLILRALLFGVSMRL